MTPKPDPEPFDDDEIILDDSTIATPPRYLTADEIVRLVREAQDLSTPPRHPGMPCHGREGEKVKREILERTGAKGDAGLDLDGDSWRMKMWKGRRS